MKKLIGLCSVLCVLCANLGALGAASVLVPKKASSVAKREESSTTTNVGASLLPTAVGLVTSVIQLQQQQKQLSAECEPTNKEIDFVNKMVKEWAIAGAANPLPLDKNNGRSGVRACNANASPKETYESTVSVAGNSLSVDSSSLCYDVFSENEARGAVWAGFPRAAVVKYCPEGGTTGCAQSKKKVASNMWDIFDMINFDEKDYTKTEASQAEALRAKAANCSSSKLAAKKMEAFGGFVTNTIGNMGQKTNTGSVMDAVTGVLGNSGGGLGNLGGLATVATQFLDK